MIRLIVFLVVATALAVGAVWLADRPGSVAIEWLGTSYNTRVDVAILLLLLVIIASIIVFEALRWLRVLPKRLSERSRHKKQVKGYQALMAGLVATAAGDSKRAKALKNDAENLLGDDPKTLLLGAQAAQLDGDEEVAEIAYRRMLKSPETSLLGLRGLLTQAVRVGDYEEAAKLAEQAYEKSPTTPWVLDTQFDILARKREWTRALKLIDEMARAKSQSEGDLAHKRAVLNHMIADGLFEKGENGPALSHAKKAVKLCPDFAPAAVLGSKIAIKSGKLRHGRRMLEDAWAVEPHPDLARAFGELIQKEGPNDRRKRWRRLQDLRPNHVETQIALAEMSLEEGDKSAARSHAEQAVQKGGTVRAYQVMARVEKETGATPDTIQKLREKATNAAMDPAWVCQDTGEMVPQWQPFGLAGRFDAIGWITPAKVSPLLRLEGPTAMPEPGPAANDTTPNLPVSPAKTAG